MVIRRSRREEMVALGCALVVLVTACQSNEAMPASNDAPSATPPSSSLQVRSDGSGDGPLIILFHGFGAPGDDLVPLSSVLRPSSDVGAFRFAFPEGPVNLGGGARAWWMLPLDALGEGPADRGEMRPAMLRQLRDEVIRWLEYEQAHDRLDPARTVIGGFSQGAMLAAEVALHWRHRVAGLLMLSGGPVNEEQWRVRLRAQPKFPVMMSHGRDDTVLSFSAAERLRDRFASNDWSIAFVPFDGGHGIPMSVIGATRQFLGTALR